MLDGVYDNTNGQLDLYDPATGQGGMTENYLQDRADMLAWKMQLRQDGVLPDDTNTLFTPNLQNTIYIDNTSQLKIVLGGTEKRIVFGGDADDTINGFIKSDNLYGGNGNDTITGNGGKDYQEGGKGNDTYVYNSGDGFDAIADQSAYWEKAKTLSALAAVTF